MIKKIINYIDSKQIQITINNNQINVINYVSILSFEDDYISLGGKDKTVVIKGNNLIITKLLNNELLIEGDYKEIEFR